MKERPILFSAPMVRAILEGRKTQTRRVVKPQPDAVHSGTPYWFVGGYRLSETAHNPLRCPYGQPGDRLWVRETWAPLEAAGTPYIYRADADEDGSVPYLVHGSPVGGGVGHANPHRWKPSIHMPRLASRILLEVVSVRVERLRDISEADAEAEGAPLELGELERVTLGAKARYRSGFCRMWSSINGRESWDANPWVWVVEFRMVTP